jgi:hypothetical protein
LREKYRGLAEPVLGRIRALRIERSIDELVADPSALPALVEELLRAGDY